jgi:hypothetical protein
MAKIYEWTYKGDSGKIIAANTKEAKREIAKKFGNAIKIPKGTVVKKIGLVKPGKQAKPAVSVAAVPLTPTSTVSMDESFVLTKEQKFTGVSLQVNGRFMYVSDEAELVAPKGARISCVKRVS